MASERAKKVSEEWFQTDTYRSPTFEEIIDKALQEERREACKPLVDALEFYSNSANLHPFIMLFLNDPLINPDGPPNAYGISDDVCLKAREALKKVGKD